MKITILKSGFYLYEFSLPAGYRGTVKRSTFLDLVRAELDNRRQVTDVSLIHDTREDEWFFEFVITDKSFDDVTFRVWFDDLHAAYRDPDEEDKF